MSDVKKHEPLIKKITPQNILSFGPETTPIELNNLNILIGPNGSGKSNLIEIINLLRSTPHDMREVIRKGGGIREWIWKGEKNAIASIEVIIDNPKDQQSLRHIIKFREENQVFHLEDERIENEHPYPDEEHPFFYYNYNNGSPIARLKDDIIRKQSLIISNASILSQRKDPDHYPSIHQISASYDQIRIYREWTLGHNAVFREPQKADMRNDRLEEDFSNLGMFLNNLRRKPKAKKAIIEGLREFYEGFDDFDVLVEGGTVQVFFIEGDYSIPSSRLSDGTLRYLCLLAILCDPDPPSLICIEEPELGIHPEVLPKLAELFIETSKKTQLIITTHSDILVDAMTNHPESILICEKHNGRTTMNHLEKKKIEIWLKKFRLGELWASGEIGGNRW
ncbi:MAG: AAA family ATPase [Methanoregula sp.]|nr:AAA family ATPase [Methanoregula sp.]